MLKSAFKCILQTTYSPLWRFHISHQTCNCNHANELMTTSFVLLTSKLWIFTQNSYRSCEALNDIPDSLTLVCNMMIRWINPSKRSDQELAIVFGDFHQQMEFSWFSWTHRCLNSVFQGTSGSGLTSISVLWRHRKPSTLNGPRGKMSTQSHFWAACGAQKVE